MPGWKFWERSMTDTEAEGALEPAGRFNLRPRNDLVGGALPPDPAQASRISALRKRRESVLFDVEQATLAGEPDNPWLERVATIDEAARAVEAELSATAHPAAQAPGVSLPATPVAISEVVIEPAPRVVIRVGDEELVYVEDLDWSERGFQLALTELHLDAGDIESLVAGNVRGDDRAELVDVLGDSLFRLATDTRDRASTSQPMARARLLSELAVPDAEFGGWVDVNGSSPRRRSHAIQVAERTGELERLRAERNRELEEMARWRERLPIAQRRLRDVDEEIAAALEEIGGRR